eukprot:4135053-Alexandrium_andersonii.AAC.1
MKGTTGSHTWGVGPCNVQAQVARTALCMTAHAAQPNKPPDPTHTRPGPPPHDNGTAASHGAMRG